MKQKRKSRGMLQASWTDELKRTIQLNIKGKTISFQPVRLGAMLAGILLALILLVNILLIPVKRPKTLDMGFETGGEYTIRPFMSHALLYNRRQMREVTVTGKTLWEAEITMSHPIMEIADQYILLADLSGNNAGVLYKKGKKIREFTPENDIISAKVNAKGMTAFATATVGYKGKVIVYDKKGKEKFNWNSGEGYILDIALDDSGRYLAVAQLSSDGTESNSKLQMIDLNRKRVIATEERPGTAISEIRFSGKRLMSVSDTEFCGFKPSGKLLFSVPFGGRNPSKYDISGNEIFAFVTTDNRGNAVLELYNNKGKQVGKYRADSTVNNLSVHKDTIVIARQRDVISINRRGKLKKTVSAEFDIKSLGLYGDGRTVLAAGNTLAYIARVK